MNTPLKIDISKTRLSFTLLAKELEEDLHRTLRYWATYALDQESGGFYGALDLSDQPLVAAPKGLVLNSRILWAYAAAAVYFKNDEYRKLADHAFRYINDNFIDRNYGGAYWSLTALGNKLEGKKQMYGIAFCIYGLSEYAKLTASDEALSLAKELYKRMEAYAFDSSRNGYMEALSEDWSPVADLRLSEKDRNAPKTANTHLHIVEAYANLYQVWPNAGLAERIRNLLHLFDSKIIDRNSFQLQLFFDFDWMPVGRESSPGHDIEAAWLLLHCASVLDQGGFQKPFRELSVAMSERALSWIDAEGGLIYEIGSDGSVNSERHWWVQAEAMVGFYNAWQLTGNDDFYNVVFSLWAFVKKFLIDHDKGEWHWGVTATHQLIDKSKAGFWKCPYHNTRACLEIIKRIRQAAIKTAGDE
ncbi:AGE family epimerase/isomerase [Niabella insulamsoli]|uniref:AGE family epimerase/isomerase n=1 Tax=Niabella insulamsoli TaxID=3144874 RepID=UPI0031FD66CF